MIRMGKHCLLNLYGCKPEILENIDLMLSILKTAAETCGATILFSVHHKFEPQGLTAILLLSESHISVHTFPEQKSAAFDIFTCGNANSKTGVQCILNSIDSDYHTLIEVGR